MGNEKRKTLKLRILTNIFIILLISMIISSVSGYIYFERVVREQKIYDEHIKLQQLSRQLEFLMEDIDSISKNIIVDEVLRKEIEKESFATELEKIKSKDNVSKRLVFYNSLRKYIGSSFLETADGLRYTSNSTEEDYLRRKFENAAIKELTENPEQVFSFPYYGLDTGNIKKVLCYRINMLDLYNFGNKYGTLYLEIYLEEFLKLIEPYSSEYESISLVGNNGNILFEQGKEISQSMIELKNEKSKLSGAHKVEGGYLIYEEIPSVDWSLGILVSNSFLWERSNFVFYFFAVSFVLSLGLIILSTSKILGNAIRPITRLSEQMEHIDYNSFDAKEMVYTKDEIQTLYECFNKMILDIQKSVQERMEYEKQKSEMEFSIMLSQIKPHYLYNVLNTVVYLAAAEKNEDVVKIVNSLIHTLQETMDLRKNNIYNTIAKELSFTESYLVIQRYRYQDSFDVKITCDENLKDALVPKTIIQPLVENSIIHGVLASEKKGEVLVKVFEREGKLVIKVEDNGISITKEKLEKFNNGQELVEESSERKHIGISNIRDRIEYLYNGSGEMKMYIIETGGTCTELIIPIKKTL